MVDGDLFDKLAKIGSILRKSPVPFGGIQVRSPETLVDTSLTEKIGYHHRRLLSTPPCDKKWLSEIRV